MINRMYPICLLLFFCFVVCPASCRMSDTADQFTSEETQDIPGKDVSLSPPPYSSQEQEPPPLDAILEMYPPSKLETSDIPPPTTEHESSCDMNPEDPSDMTPAEAPSAFDDKIIRRGFVRKVGATTRQYFFKICLVHQQCSESVTSP